MINAFRTDRLRVPEGPHFIACGSAYAGLALLAIVFGGSSQKFIYFDF